MPKTKLSKDYTPPTKKTQVEDNNIMDDFEAPDELRKNLDYRAQQALRQKKVEHAERKLTERLEAINLQLKAERAKVSVCRVGDSLYLQASLPLKPDETSKDGKVTKQTKIALKVSFSANGLKTAEEEARELAKLIARKTFTWTEKYLGTKTTEPEVQLTIGEILEQFKAIYFEKRAFNRQSETTFYSYVKYILQYADVLFPLTDESILKTINKTRTGTGNRRALVSSLSVLCGAFKYKFDFSGHKNGYKPRERKLPTDEEIESKFYNFKPSQNHPQYQWVNWQWVYGMLATYGLRPHEVFAIDLAAYIDPTNTMHVVRLDEKLTEGIKTGNRDIFPLHPEWVQLFDLKNIKPLNLKATFLCRSARINQTFVAMEIGFKPYDLRHAYAVRGHVKGIPIKEMCDNMGHSFDMHSKTYQKYISLDTRRSFYQQALNKAEDSKQELSELELLRIENATLKAQNEELRALLTKHQLQGLLSL